MDNPLIYHSETNEKSPRRVSFVGLVKNKELHIGMSLCSRKDHFIKKKGVSIAKSRANGIPAKVVAIVDKGKTAKQFVAECNLITKEIK